MKNRLILGGASVALVLAASATSAQTYSADFKLHDTTEGTRITGPDVVNTTGYSSAMEVTLSSGGLPAQTLYAFCVDAAHQIGLTATGLSYTEIPLSTDTFGTPGDTTLSTMQVEQIGALADYGAGLATSPATSGSSTLGEQLAGVQDAIWDIEYAGTGDTFTPVGKDATAVDAFVVADLAYATANPLSSPFGVEAIVPTTGNTQAFVLGNPSSLGGGAGAPEPASWALMIVGLGGVGGMMRRRRLTVGAVTL